MYFDFEGRNFDTPTVESAVSWREQLLVSVFAHLAAVMAVLVIPQLPAVQESAARRAERLAEITELQQQARLMEAAEDDRTFVFMAPRVETPPDEAPRPDAPLSDRDRVAESPVRTLDPQNRLPVADGNSLEFVESEDPDEGFDPVGNPSEEVPDPAMEPDDAPEADVAPTETRVDATRGDGESDETSDALSDDPGALADDTSGVAALADSSSTTPGSGPGDPDESDSDNKLRADGLLGQVRETLRRSVRRQQSFGNVSGDTGRYGPEIRFDAKGVDFGPWIRRFVAQIRRNWFIPYSVLANHGHVVITFNVHRDGSLTDLSVLKPSGINSFNQSASNALRLSNPTQPLPAEYPDDQAFFTVTFYFNEYPPRY